MSQCLSVGEEGGPLFCLGCQTGPQGGTLSLVGYQGRRRNKTALIEQGVAPAQAL